MARRNAQRVQMCEVGLRDGLQVEAAFVPTAEKIALCNALSRAGMAKIEVTAFVSPQAIPALRDAEVVLREIERVPGVAYTALVPNVRGAERAIDARADEMNLVMSASESHNLANLRMTARAVVARARRGGGARAAGRRGGERVAVVQLRLPDRGRRARGDVLAWCARFVDELGAGGITLCDTTGMAYPGQVHALTRAFMQRWPGTGLTLHFHNTRGMGLANVLAGIDAGARRFDASIGGIGGCPYAPGATGNVCSEDIVHALDLMGYDTGVDLARVMAAARRCRR
jgi:hydroxymethylglutaryl-CoA lyase